MVSIIVAGHGEFPTGLMNAVKMILGEQKNTETVSLLPKEGPDDLMAKINNAIDGFKDKKALILLDFMGGTPYNVSQKIYDGRDDVELALVTGTSMPLAIEAFSAKDEYDDPKELAKYLLSVSSEAVKTYPEFKVAAKKAQAPSASSQPAVKVDKTPKKDKNSFLDIVLMRLDSRLIHGQVAMNWTKHVNPTRLLVVSNSVDELRKRTLKSAAPQGTKVNIISTKKFIDFYHDPRLANDRFLVLFNSIGDILEVVENIDEIKLPSMGINFGSYAPAKDSVALNQALSVTKKDAEMIKEIGKKYKLTSQQIPTREQEDVLDLLKKKGF